MIRFTLNNQTIEVPKGTTLLRAALQLGYEIPMMCHLEGIQEQPSCMVCAVKDLKTGRIHPSCATPAAPGMDIITDSEEITAFRKQALELLMSDHTGDCEAPCRLACPAFMDIPLMNRLIAEGKFTEALEVVKEEIALPHILGYICPAPCEKVCKRKPIDGAVSICLLKRFAAETEQDPFVVNHTLPKRSERVAIIGTGPAGLSAAYFLLKEGYECVLLDKQSEPGGALRYSISDAELPREVLDAEIEQLKKMGAQFVLDTEQSVTHLQQNGYGSFHAFLLATGSQDVHPLDEEMNHHFNHSHHFVNRETGLTALPGVFACGSIIRDLNMAVKAGQQGKLAAHNIHNYLRGLPLQKEHYPFNSLVGQLKPEEYPEYLKESIDKARNVPAYQNQGSFTAEEAMKEAARCMHCDCRNLDSCRLRAHSDKYRVERRRFAGPDRKPVVKHFQHEQVVFEPEKCIKCNICVELTRRESESLGLSFVGRGFDVKVDMPFGRDITESLRTTAEKCADACPTGALARKGGREHKPLSYTDV